MARESNAMSAAEVREFLAGVEWAALGTLRAEGAPAPSVAAILVQDDRLYFAAPEAAAGNLAGDARCCVCADIFPSYYEIRGATVHGVAERADPPQALAIELQRRAQAHGLAFGPVYALPLLEDSFGFDFSKIKARL